MALARIARSNLRRSGVAFGSNAYQKDMFNERSHTTKKPLPSSHVDGTFSYISKIKEHNRMHFSLRGISGTPYYRTPSSNTQRVVEESESELEDDRQRYAGLEATKPGEKPRVVVLGTGWAACRFLKGLDTRIYDVVCISPRNHMVFTPLLASTCVGTLEFRSVAEPIGSIQDALSKDPNSHFLLASCTNIDTNKHEVSKMTYPSFDRLIICVHTKFFLVKCLVSLDFNRYTVRQLPTVDCLESLTNLKLRMTSL